jgi:hypothetical protein
VGFDAVAVRFGGTITELTEEEVESSGLDAVAVWVVVVNTNGVSVKTAKDGTVTRINVFKVTDGCLVPDDLKTLLVEKLGLDLREPVPVTSSNPRSYKTNYAGSNVLRDGAGVLLDGFPPSDEQLVAEGELL